MSMRKPGTFSQRMRTIGIRFSVAVTSSLMVLLIAVGIWVQSVGFFTIMEGIFVKPPYERWVSQWDLLPVHEGDTVFLGDSLTEYGMWEELFPQSNTRNRGIVGDTTSGVLARVEQVADGQAEQVFLLIGTNDLFAGVSQEEIIANILTIIDEIQASSPETDIYVQSLLPRQAVFTEQIEALNAELETAIAGKATWVNLYPLFLDEAGTSLDDSLTNDELHLLGEGYLIWRDAIAHLVNDAN